MKRLIMMIMAGLCVVACKEEEDVQTETSLYEIISYTENGITATIYSDQEELIVGYNNLTVKFESESLSLESEPVTVSPVMDMTTMTHSCPLEYQDSIVTEGEISLGLTFLMASGEMGSWTVAFALAETSITIPVTVNEPEYSRLVSFTSDTNGITYYVAYIEPMDPEVGQNDMEIAVYKKVSMMNWPAVDGLTFEMTPWMPSMEHSSPNNVDPVNTSNGHYEGTVNFTMTGDWEIQLTMMDGDTVLGEPYFELYFQ